jgi:hypothetical protein
MNSTERDLVERLHLAITTASNDDLSKPMSDKRTRHVERIAVMREAADALALARKRMTALEQDLISSAIARANSDNALASIRAERDEAVADKARVDELLTAAVDDYNDAIQRSANVVLSHIAGMSGMDVMLRAIAREIQALAPAARAIAGEPKHDD